MSERTGKKKKKAEKRQRKLAKNNIASKGNPELPQQDE